MPESGGSFQIALDGERIPARADWSIAAAMLNAGCTRFRRSVGGQARAPLCGMGICFECRVTIDGATAVRSCMVACRPDLDVRTEVVDD